MTALENSTVRPEPRTISERLARVASKSPVHIILGLIGLVWLVPTIGLFITSFSFAPETRLQTTGAEP